MDSLTSVDRVGGQDVAPGDAPSARRARFRIRPVRWHVLWGSFKRAWPLARFVLVFGGAWFFNLSGIAQHFAGSYLVRPTSACLSAVLAALGKHVVAAAAANGAAVRLDLGLGGMWIQPQCTPAAAWTMWVAFLIALPIGWRARAIVLPAGLAALWILNTVRLSSVLLAYSAGQYALAKTLHDQAWPWLTGLVMVAGAWASLRRDSAKQRQVAQPRSVKGGERT